MRMDSLSLNHFRRRLGQVDALPQWVLLGIASGLITGLVVLAFRAAITWPLEAWLPGGDSEYFEGLPPLLRAALPVGGSLLLIIFFGRLPGDAQKVGIPHVLERLNYHQGRLPAANLLAQFVGGALALVSGHSAGREGPAVHLGAAGASLLGQSLKLPNNSIRTLVGCGTAASIAASFNTPIAGVIFAMEVVMLEYTVAGFIPVLIAAVCATLLMQWVHLEGTAFQVPAFEIRTLDEVPFIVLLGTVVGGLSVLFHKLTLASTRTGWSLPQRFAAAGLLTGLVALALPQVMGIGYDTVTDALQGNLGLELLIALALVKLLVTGASVGLGLPIGLIGPTLFIGAAAGGAIGLLGIMAAGQPVSAPGFYAMLGMGAMMGAVLQAPLAALMALLELTLNPNIIFPGMLAVVTATLINRYVCHQGSLFQALLGARGLDWRRPPLDQALDRASVVEVMNGAFLSHGERVDRHDATRLADYDQQWILLTSDDGQRTALACADLKVFLRQHADADAADDDLNLMEIPALRRDLAEIRIDATLTQALREMDAHNMDALLVRDHAGQAQGLVFREEINRFFMHR